MEHVQVAHTADIGERVLKETRAFLESVFQDDPLTPQDWEHALGGMHVLLWDDELVIGHASVVQRRIMHEGRALRTGYVEAVAVRGDRRRRGHGDTLMQEVERIIRGAYELGALGATDQAVPFYLNRGWKCWTGPTSALTPDGVRRTPDADGDVYVLPVAAELDLTGDIVCDWRDGSVW